jgi:hypothetical protein
VGINLRSLQQELGIKNANCIKESKNRYSSEVLQKMVPPVLLCRSETWTLTTHQKEGLGIRNEIIKTMRS